MEESPKFNRRELVKKFLEKFLWPVFLILVTVWFTSWWNLRDRQQHDLSVTVLKSGNADPPTKLVADPNADPLLTALGAGVEVEQIDPDGFYIYTAFIKNQGDFPEEDIHIIMHTNLYQGVDNENMSEGFSVRTSSTLLEMQKGIRDIDTSPIPAGISFQLPIKRLNPGEWVTIETKWKKEVKIDLEARSTTDSASATS